MLLLVLAYRHMGRAINQDVGRHQIGIGEETDGCVLTVLAGLVLELRHAAKPTHACDAIEYPGKLRMLVDLALVEDDVSFRINSGGEIGGGHFARVVREPLRTAPNRYRLGQRMEIDDAIDAGIPLLQRDELHDRAEIVAEMQITGWLNPGKNQFFERHRAAPRLSRVHATAPLR